MREKSRKRWRREEVKQKKLESFGAMQIRRDAYLDSLLFESFGCVGRVVRWETRQGLDELSKRQAN